MILTCPECATRYETGAAKFPAAGRKVRCAKCGHVWHQAGPQPEPDPELFGIPPDEPVQEPEPVSAPRPVPATPRRSAFAPDPKRDIADDEEPQPAQRSAGARKGWERVGAMFGWVGLVGVILIICWSAVSYRQQIATVWPQSASLFTRLGMAVNVRGIEFVDVRPASQREDGQPVLVIRGVLRNVGTRTLAVPPIRVVLSDASAHVLYGWNFAPKMRELAPGETTSFHARLSIPPAAARHVNVRFADSKE